MHIEDWRSLATDLAPAVDLGMGVVNVPMNPKPSLSQLGIEAHCSTVICRMISS